MDCSAITELISTIKTMNCSDRIKAITDWIACLMRSRLFWGFLLLVVLFYILKLCMIKLKLIRWLLVGFRRMGKWVLIRSSSFITKSCCFYGIGHRTFQRIMPTIRRICSLLRIVCFKLSSLSHRWSRNAWFSRRGMKNLKK